MCKLAAAFAAALVCSCAPVRAMNVVVTPDANMAANPAAVAAFNRAAQSWSNVFTNDMTVNIDAGFSNTFPSPNILGSASSVKLQAPYDFFRGKIVDSAAKEADDAIVAFVPTLAQFHATLPTGITFDDKFIATKANFKALGYMKLIDLDAKYGATDSTITFNSNFQFDYDNGNGVTPGTVDFQSLATHEIGHALGFISSVDTVDALKAAGATNASVEITPLDLFRFENGAGGNPDTGADFTNFSRFLDTGGSANFDDTTIERAMSTGRATGDGNEASHWKDDAFTGHLLGVMDPSLNAGLVESITANDIRALDLIGYDAVPEPGALPLLALLVPIARYSAQRRIRESAGTS